MTVNQVLQIGIQKIKMYICQFQKKNKIIRIDPLLLTNIYVHM